MDPVTVGLLATALTSVVVNILQALRTNVKSCKWWGGGIEFKNNTPPKQSPREMRQTQGVSPSSQNININLPDQHQSELKITSI